MGESRHKLCSADTPVRVLAADQHLRGQCPRYMGAARPSALVWDAGVDRRVARSQ